MLFHVYDEPVPEGYFVNEPFGIYRTILDADWLLYILLPLLAAVIVALLMLGWRVHEIPKHKADHKTMRQAELVTALTLLGLIEHWVWAVALFIAYMDWGAAEDWLVGILRKARQPEPAMAATALVPPAADVAAASVAAAASVPPPSPAGKVEPIAAPPSPTAPTAPSAPEGEKPV